MYRPWIAMIVLTAILAMPTMAPAQEEQKQAEEPAQEQAEEPAEEVPADQESTTELTPLVINPGEDTFKGKGTDMVFPKEIVASVDGLDVPMVALGSGVRKKMVFKVYEGVAYVEQGIGLEADPYNALIEGKFAKRILMFFERDVGGGKIRGAYEDGFKKVQGDDVWSESLLQNIDVFLSYFDEESGVKDQQTIELTWIPGRGLYTLRAGVSYPPIDDAELVSALWAIWFGDQPVSGDLKRDMIRFLTEEEDTP